MNNNPANRIADFLASIGKTVAKNQQATYLACFNAYFGQMPIQDIFLRLNWLSKELAICKEKVGNESNLKSHMDEVEPILNATCIRENAKHPLPATLIAFQTMATFAFLEYTDDASTVDEILAAVEELKKQIVDSEDDNSVKVGIEEILTEVTTAIENKNRFGLGAIKDKPEALLGKFILMVRGIKSLDIRTKLWWIIETFFKLAERANTVMSLADSIKKLIP
ncbi:MAG: hypothetical protein PHE67_00280 [Campylobacterales bacterium]|nr:hypothetical protein [Campylobacterales bacterium]